MFNKEPRFADYVLTPTVKRTIKKSLYLDMGRAKLSPLMFGISHAILCLDTCLRECGHDPKLGQREDWFMFIKPMDAYMISISIVVAFTFARLSEFFR